MGNKLVRFLYLRNGLVECICNIVIYKYLNDGIGND